MTAALQASTALQQLNLEMQAASLLSPESIIYDLTATQCAAGLPEMPVSKRGDDQNVGWQQPLMPMQLKVQCSYTAAELAASQPLCPSSSHSPA